MISYATKISLMYLKQEINLQLKSNNLDDETLDTLVYIIRLIEIFEDDDDK
jgi:hypothetical protein